MGFFDNISTFGTFEAKATKQVTKSDKLSKMRDGFIARADRQISYLNGTGGERDRKWYVARPNDGGTTDYLLGLRNGAALIPLAGSMKYVRVTSAERAIEFYEQAVMACKSGQLDDILKSTGRKQRQSAPGHAAAVASDIDR
jgi:hypothetical protein